MKENIWLAEVTARQTVFLEDLKKLLSINSVKDLATIDSEHPVGIGPKTALEAFFAMAERDGFTVKRIGNIAGHISYGTGEEIVGVLGHVDVVPTGDGWHSDPFVPEIRAGQLCARGVLDDKGPLMAAYYGLKILKEKNIACHKEVRLIVGSDEESEWACMNAYFAEEPLPDLGFSPDGFFPVVNGEKGIVNFQVTFPEVDEADLENEMLSFTAGKKENMVPDKAKVELRVAHPELFLVSVADFARKYQITYQEHTEGKQIHLIFEGKSAHSMNPQTGKNAGTYLLSFLHEIGLFQKERAFLAFTHKYLHEDHAGERLGIACCDQEMGEVSVCPAIFRYEKASGGSILLNIRYPKETDEEQITSKMRQLVGTLGARSQMIDSKACHYVSKEDFLVKTLLEIYERQTGTTSAPISIGGATYARLMEKCVAFGALFPGRPNTMHQANESMSIDDLLLSASIYTEALYRLTRGIK